MLNIPSPEDSLASPRSSKKSYSKGKKRKVSKKSKPSSERSQKEATNSSFNDATNRVSSQNITSQSGESKKLHTVDEE